MSSWNSLSLLPFNLRPNCISGNLTRHHTLVSCQVATDTIWPYIEWWKGEGISRWYWLVSLNPWFALFCYKLTSQIKTNVLSWLCLKWRDLEPSRRHKLFKISVISWIMAAEGPRLNLLLSLTTKNSKYCTLQTSNYTLQEILIKKPTCKKKRRKKSMNLD